MYKNTDTHKHRHTQTQTHTNTDTHRHRHTHTQTHTNTDTHTQTHTHRHTHAQTYTQRHIHTHTHTGKETNMRCHVTIIFLSLKYLGRPGYRSQHSDSLRSGRSTDRIPLRVRFSALVHTAIGAHPPSCRMYTRSLFRGIAVGAKL